MQLGHPGELDRGHLPGHDDRPRTRCSPELVRGEIALVSPVENEDNFCRGHNCGDHTCPRWFQTSTGLGTGQAVVSGPGQARTSRSTSSLPSSPRTNVTACVSSCVSPGRVNSTSVVAVMRPPSTETSRTSSRLTSDQVLQKPA